MDRIMKGNHSAVILFLDSLNEKASFILNQLEEALNSTTKTFGAKPFVACYVGKNFTAEEQADYKLSKFPTLRVYLPTGIITYDGRFFASQMSNFLKRNLRSNIKRFSTILKELTQYESLEQQDEPFVIFCGTENSPEFKLYEQVARDSKFLYYHTFDKDLCTRLNAKRLGMEDTLWKESPFMHTLDDQDKKEWLFAEERKLRERHERGLLTEIELAKKVSELVPPITSEEIERVLDEEEWKKYILPKENSIFVVYKPNESFEILDKFTGLEQLKNDILFASINNFYSNFDRAYDFLFEAQFKDKFFALFSPHNQSIEESPCNEIYRLSLKYRLTDKNLKFGCFSKKELAKFGLEIQDKDPLENTVFYFNYVDLKEKTKEARVSRPFKYKLSAAAEENIEPFLLAVETGRVPKYYISEEPPKKQPRGSRAKYLVKSTFKEWVEENLKEKNVAVMLYYSKSSIPKNITTEFNVLIKEMQEHIVFGEIDIALNELDDVLEQDESQKMLLWVKGQDFSSPIKILNPTQFDSLKPTLASHIPELAEIYPEDVLKKAAAAHDHDHHHDHHHGHHHHDHDHHHHDHGHHDHDNEDYLKIDL